MGSRQGAHHRVAVIVLGPGLSGSWNIAILFRQVMDVEQLMFWQICTKKGDIRKKKKANCRKNQKKEVMTRMP